MTLLLYSYKIFTGGGFIVVKATSKRQITFPVQELDGPSVDTSAQIELKKEPGEFVQQPGHIDYSRLGFLKDKIDPNVEPFDLEKFRDKICNPATNADAIFSLSMRYS